MSTARKKIRVNVKKGVRFEIEPSVLHVGSQLQPALSSLLQKGDIKHLAASDKLALTKKRSLVGRGENALIIRFDLKVIRIDEKFPIDVTKLGASRRK